MARSMKSSLQLSSSSRVSWVLILSTGLVLSSYALLQAKRIILDDSSDEGIEVNYEENKNTVWKLPRPDGSKFMFSFSGSPQGCEHGDLIVDAMHVWQPHHCFVVDAGGHHGLVAVIAAMQHCDVITFELDSLHRIKIQKNVHANNLEQHVHVYPGLKGGVEEVSAIHTIDDAVPTAAEFVIIKLDVDGAELELLEQASATLKRTALINMEFTPADVKNVKAVLGLMEGGWAVMPHTCSHDVSQLLKGTGVNCPHLSWSRCSPPHDAHRAWMREGLCGAHKGLQHSQFHALATALTKLSGSNTSAQANLVLVNKHYVNPAHCSKQLRA
mmetsp:Transcript_35562/g.78947  ORF Transcript_35562/g.78947 Transcript_35562/m.78947 type:complete len:328 (-) Transcript_35562:537-1520(-)